MPSRFAVLKIEGDDFTPPNTNKTKEKKKVDANKQNGKKPEKSSSAQAKKPAKVRCEPKVGCIAMFSLFFIEKGQEKEGSD